MSRAGKPSWSEMGTRLRVSNDEPKTALHGASQRMSVQGLWYENDLCTTVRQPVYLHVNGSGIIEPRQLEMSFRTTTSLSDANDTLDQNAVLMRCRGLYKAMPGKLDVNTFLHVSF